MVNLDLDVGSFAIPTPLKCINAWPNIQVDKELNDFELVILGGDLNFVEDQID